MFTRPTVCAALLLLPLAQGCERKAPSTAKQTQAPNKPAVPAAVPNRIDAALLGKTPLTNAALIEAMRSAARYKKMDIYSPNFDLSALSGLPFEIVTGLIAANQDVNVTQIAYDPAQEEMTITVDSSQTGGGGNRAIGIYRKTNGAGAFEGSNAFGVRRQVTVETTDDYGLAETIKYMIGEGPGSTYKWSVRLSPALARLASHNLRLKITGHVQRYDNSNSATMQRLLNYSHDFGSNRI